MKKKLSTLLKTILMLAAGGLWYILNTKGEGAEPGPDVNNLYISLLFTILWIIFLIRNKNNIVVSITSALLSLYGVVSIALFYKFIDIKENTFGDVDYSISRFSRIARTWACGFDYKNYTVGQADGLSTGLVIFILLTLLAVTLIFVHIANNYEIEKPRIIIERLKEKNSKLIKEHKSWYIASICFLIIVIFLLFSIEIKTDREMIYQLFDIDVSDYEIVEVNDYLHKYEYNGKYEVLLRLEKEQLDAFIASIDNRYYFYDDEYTRQTFVENVTGREWNSNDMKYESLGSVKRKLPFFISEPKTVISLIVISEAGDAYNVELYYIE